jgi:hypothetical protein
MLQQHGKPVAGKTFFTKLRALYWLLVIKNDSLIKEEMWRVIGKSIRMAHPTQ